MTRLSIEHPARQRFGTITETIVPARPLTSAPTGSALAAPRALLETDLERIEVLVNANDGHSVYTQHWAVRGRGATWIERREHRGMRFDDVVDAARASLR